MKSHIDSNVVGLFALGLWMTLLLCSYAWAGGEKSRIVWMTDDSIATVPVTPRGTVINFPAKPTKVILGRQGSFGLEFVEEDLAVSPLGPGVRSHLFVYLSGRRFTLDLVASTSGEAIVNIRDAKEKRLMPNGVIFRE